MYMYIDFIFTYMYVFGPEPLSCHLNGDFHYAQWNLYIGDTIGSVLVKHRHWRWWGICHTNNSAESAIFIDPFDLLLEIA